MRAVLVTKREEYSVVVANTTKKLHLRKEIYKHILGKVCVATPYKVRQFE